jgi:methyl-accepting chemotaxis protein
MEEINKTLTMLQKIVSSKIESTQNLQSVALKGEKEMEEAIKTIRKITESAHVIMNLLKVINDISAQTNLLAMNAAIEAAHAGDSGRGFSVVANEIRALATTTANNAKEISLSLKNVLQLINSSEKSTNDMGHYFKNIVTDISHVVESISELNPYMNDLTLKSTRVTQALQNLSSSGIELKNNSAQNAEKIVNFLKVLDNLSFISSETKNGIREINIAVEMIFKTVQIVADSGKTNNEKAQEIRILVDKFKTDESGIQ